MLASAPLFPKFVSNRAAMDHELRKRGTRVHSTRIESRSDVTERECALDSVRLSHFLRQTGVQPGSNPGQAFGGKCASPIGRRTIAACELHDHPARAGSSNDQTRRF